MDEDEIREIIPTNRHTKNNSNKIDDAASPIDNRSRLAGDTLNDVAAHVAFESTTPTRSQLSISTGELSDSPNRSVGQHPVGYDGSIPVSFAANPAQKRQETTSYRTPYAPKSSYPSGGLLYQYGQLMGVFDEP